MSKLVRSYSFPNYMIKMIKPSSKLSHENSYVLVECKGHCLKN